MKAFFSHFPPRRGGTTLPLPQTVPSSIRFSFLGHLPLTTASMTHSLLAFPPPSPCGVRHFFSRRASFFASSTATTAVRGTVTDHEGGGGGGPVQSFPTALWKSPLPHSLPSSCYTVQVARGSGPGGQGVNSSSNKVMLHVQLDALKPYLCDDAVGEDYLGRMIRALQEVGGVKKLVPIAAGMGSERGGAAVRGLYTRKSRKQHRKWLSQQLQHHTTTHTNDSPHHVCGSRSWEVEEEEDTNGASFSSTVWQEHPLGVLHLSSHAHRSRAANEAYCIQLALDRLRRVEEGVLAAGRKKAAWMVEQARQTRSQWAIQRPRGEDGKKKKKYMEKETPLKGDEEEEKTKTNRAASSIWETNSATDDRRSTAHLQRNGERGGGGGGESLCRRMSGPTTTSSLHSLSRPPHETKNSAVVQKNDALSDWSASVPTTHASSSTSTCHGGESAARRAQPSFFFSPSFASYLTKQKKKRREKGAMRVAQRAARTGKW